MKKISVIALALVASTVVLSGCGEKKIEPNNYYCTGSFEGGKYDREDLEELARQGRIDNVTDFLEQCEIKKLGSYSDALSTVAIRLFKTLVVVQVLLTCWKKLK